MFWLYLVPVWAVGAASHFFYQWSGQNWLMGLLFPHNESVWEHGKLGFWPLCLALLVRGLLTGAAWPGLCCAMAWAALFCLIHTIGLFYTYTGALGVWSVLPADIGIFLLSSGLGLYLGWVLLERPVSPFWGALFALVLALAAVCLLLWSLYPPRLPLFTDYSKKK